MPDNNKLLNFKDLKTKDEDPSVYKEGQGFDINEDLAVIADKRGQEGKKTSLIPVKVVAYNDEGIALGEMPLPKKGSIKIEMSIKNFVDL